MTLGNVCFRPDSRVAKSLLHGRAEFHESVLAGDHFDALRGLFGTIWTENLLPPLDNSDKVYYTSHTTDEIGTVADGRLQVASMFWLSVGCLLASNGTVYCLDNVQYFHSECDLQPDSSSRSARSSVVDGYHREGHGGSDCSLDEMRARRLAQRELELPRHRANMERTTAVRLSSYVVPQSRPPPLQRRHTTYYLYTLEFKATDERFEELSRVADALDFEAI